MGRKSTRENNKKNTAILYYACAVAFYALAASNLFSEETRTMGIIWLCMGSTFLCLGSVFKNKNKDDGDKTDKTQNASGNGFEKDA